VKQENALETLQKLKKLVISYTDNEFTGHPWWAIVKKASFGRLEILEGPYFSREAAEKHRKARIYEYGEKSFVYCFSAYYSREYRELLDILKHVPDGSGDEGQGEYC